MCQGIIFLFANYTTLNSLHFDMQHDNLLKKGIIEGCSHSLWEINMMFYTFTSPGPRWWCYNSKLKGEELKTLADLADSIVSDIRVWLLI